MQKLCYLLPLGNELHIFGGYDAKLYDRHRVNYYGNTDGNAHNKRHHESAVGRKQIHYAVIYRKRYDTHDSAGHGRTDENILH